jgi:hypothetical protein
MEIKISNESTTYIAEVTEFDHYKGSEPAEGTKHTLQPGESVTVTVWDTHYPVVREIKEVKQEEPTGSA